MNRLFWITGLAGAGKTTIARVLRASLQQQHVPVVLLDGDELRSALSMTERHAPADRLWLARCYAGLGKLLHSQGMNVVCATISPFPEVREELRASVSGYVEVYVRASSGTLQQRDQKGLYSGVQHKSVMNMVGHDIPFAAPESPDLIIDNEPGTNVQGHVAEILKVISPGLRRSA